MGFPRQEYQSGLSCPPPGNLSSPGIKPVSLESPAVAGKFFTTSATWEAHKSLQSALIVEVIREKSLLPAKAAAKLLQSCPTLVRPHRRQPTRLLHPWDSPGKNTGVGCHFLLQYMKVKSESEVTQSCPTLCDPMDCSPPGSSVHGIFQARVLERVAIAFYKISSLLIPGHHLSLTATRHKQI